MHDHVLSETSQKLFQRAIIASASALNPWAITMENHLRRCILFGKYAPNLNDCFFLQYLFLFYLAEEHGVYTNDTNEIISFLQNTDAALFFDMTSIMWSDGLDNHLNEVGMPWGSWAPVIERK